MYSFSDFRTLPVEMRGKSFRDFLNKNKPGLTEKDIIEINRKLTEIAERS
jgi:hypothetical protein